MLKNIALNIVCIVQFCSTIKPVLSIFVWLFYTGFTVYFNLLI